MQKTCQTCEQEFEAISKNARFCAPCGAKRIEERSKKRHKVVSKEPDQGWKRAIMEDMANPFNAQDLQRLCAKYHITLDQFFKYKDSVPNFDDQIDLISQKYKDQQGAFFWKMLTKRVKEGSDIALKMYGELIREYNPKAQASPYEGMSEEAKRKRLTNLLKKAEDYLEKE